jgi:alpha-tubulin suppressor-like RCC1 family protein
LPRLLALVLPLSLIVSSFSTGALAEQAGSAVPRFHGGLIDAGGLHGCAILDNGTVRCWGYAGAGQLGYGNPNHIGDDETPGSVGPVSLGTGRTARAITTALGHTCALLDNGAVRCWGWGASGRLGYGHTSNIGDDETPGSVGPVDLGPGRTARAIAAGGSHTCAILDNASVRCWGYGLGGQLGYGDTNHIGDDEAPGSVGPVNLGSGRTARAITAGSDHTCAILDNGSVRCWGHGGVGQLGYGNTHTIGDNETPGSVGPVDLGPGRTARAIAAGGSHTCAILDNGSVRCWGLGGFGQLGYGDTNHIGDDEAPGSVGPVNLGPGRTARAITAGDLHTCAVLDNGSVRCWGLGDTGRLGYGDTNHIGDDEAPGSVGPVDLGSGRTARAITAGGAHTCAILDNGSVRCWGDGGSGRLGYGNTHDIGDNEAPGSVGPVDLIRAIYIRGPARLTLRSRPTRDALAPFVFKLSGKIPLGGFAPPPQEACTGGIGIKVQRGSTTIASMTAKLVPQDAACTYARTVRFKDRSKLGSASELGITATFGGNQLLKKAAKKITVSVT